MSYGAERIFVLEPIGSGVFSETYKSEEDGMLVHLLRELNMAVCRQCAARRNRSEEAQRKVRDSIVRRLIGVEDSELERLVSR